MKFWIFVYISHILTVIRLYSTYGTSYFVYLLNITILVMLSIYGIWIDIRYFRSLYIFSTLIFSRVCTLVLYYEAVLSKCSNIHIDLYSSLSCAFQYVNDDSSPQCMTMNDYFFSFSGVIRQKRGNAENILLKISRFS